VVEVVIRGRKENGEPFGIASTSDPRRVKQAETMVRSDIVAEIVAFGTLGDSASAAARERDLHKFARKLAVAQSQVA